MCGAAWPVYDNGSSWILGWLLEAFGLSIRIQGENYRSMCGITGFWSPGGLASDASVVLGRMTDALRHRGPDDQGAWLDPGAGIALGHRRLSIIDLSPQGHQPMISASGRFVIVFNGEIYNWQGLRREEELHGARWRGHSDTEVLLAIIERRGLEPALRACVGMFAFALWDRQDRRLALVRDRVGEKPLYYGWLGDALAFASELKALRLHPGWVGSLDRDAVALFLRHSYVPAPRSIYTGIAKAPTGAILTFREGSHEPDVQRYWSARDVVERGLADPLTGGMPEVLDQLDARLRETIGREMVADVPLGAFLSGGIDSSLVVALMQAQSPRPIKTFTIGFSERGYNEAEHAKAVARHLGTEHTDLYLTPAETLAVVPALPTLYDEPFADSSQVPTFLVARLARGSVTVSLSGDGGDELFGGYDRYLLANRWWSFMSMVPRVFRRVAARSLLAVTPAQWDRALGVTGAHRLRVRPTGDRVHKFAEVLTAGGLDDLYFRLVSHWRAPEELVVGVTDAPRLALDEPNHPVTAHAASRMMYLDLISYLPDDILVKVDRATMGVSLESRAPYLDHTILEFAWRIPVPFKVSQRQGKVVLRDLLARYVPASLFERPKMGFSVPIEHWLRGPLKTWATDLLAEDGLRRDGYLDPYPVSQHWREHQSGSRNWQTLLWNILMFQAWLRAQ